jgi:superfamily II DNA or RNA helicase
VLVIVHRIELVDQVVARLSEFGVHSGIIAGKYSRDLSLRIQTSMIQSLDSEIAWKPDYIIIDECHHSPAGTYTKLWTIFPRAKILGVTATPIRLDGRGFRDHYEDMLNLYPLRYFFENKFLVKPKHYLCSVGKLDVNTLLRGDYHPIQLSKTMRQKRQLAKIVESYLMYTNNQRSVVFTIDIDHSRSVVNEFQRMGIHAAHLDGQAHPTERKQIIDDFKAGRIKVICNYDIISEGFDVPAIESVILARRTKSLSQYVQQVGRCLRPAPGKEFGYVLDCANLWLEHGFAGIDYHWTLDGKKDDVKSSITTSKLFVKDRLGRVKTVLPSEEIDGVELISLHEEFQRLLTFDRELDLVLEKREDPREAFERYQHFIEFQGLELTQAEIEYCREKLAGLGCHLAA